MKKKVIIVVHHLTFGGIQKSCMDVLHAIDYNRFDVTLYVRKNRMALKHQIDSRVKVIVNEDPTRYYRRIKSVFYLFQEKMFEILGLTQLAECTHQRLVADINASQISYEKKHYLQGTHYDVAVAYSGGYDAVLTAQAVDADKKYIFFHGSEDEYRDIQKTVLPCFDGLIAVNDGVADLIRQWYPDLKDRVDAIENYVNAAEVRRKASQTLALSHDRTLVLCSCGRYAAVKGFDLAVRAAVLLKERGIDFLWYFVGDGPERPVLEKLVMEHGLQGHIVMTGMQENPYPYINACDIYVQPSRAESHSLTIVEAQVLGKPCVSTTTLGGKYLVKNMHNGLLADIAPESIAGCIEKLAADGDLRRQMVQALGEIDYEQKREQYQMKWNALLAQED